MSYEEGFSLLYDSIYSTKDYERECDFIISLVGENKKILDVGCGTGKHSAVLSKRSDSVYGIDISKDMINLANKNNFSLKNVKFDNISINDCVLKNSEKYDAVICMFNVVNHINSLKELIHFFNSCSKSLKEGGYFIFDCWNSVACTIEKH